MHVKTLIIGNGFAGRSVARALGSDCLIVERGEKINIFERRQKFEAMEKSNRHDALIRRSYESKHAFNTPESLGPSCASEYILVDGGCSNHWGGLSFRLSEGVFAHKGDDFAWPFTLEQMQPYYRNAEQLLRIASDPKDPDGRNSVSSIKGAEKWHSALGKYFPGAYVGAQAHNLTPTDSGQGSCLGAGDCELCPMDAKTRSLHISCGTEVRNGVLVESLRFEDGRAVEALCRTEHGETSITFDRVVVAAHGVESFKLLCKSNLPAEVPRHLLGHHYQDHAVAEMACILPGSKIPFLQVNTAAQIVIPELSGELDGIEFTTLALMTPPSDSAVAAAIDLEKIKRWDLKAAIEDLGSVLSLYVLLEIPPQWDVSMSYENGKLEVDMRGYHQNKTRYDRIIGEINARLEALGAIPLKSAEQRHYLNAAGTHHLVGTLGMGSGPRAVVGEDFRLKGTDNVFVVGSSVFPRCGSRNPTVTVVALSLMLGEQLKALPERVVVSE